MRYLTKSRYKLAKECPHKLYYTSRKEYYNNKIDNDFLMALAEGGFQVGELAKHYYPGGVMVETLDFEQSLNETKKLLEQENVIIYEGAFLFDTLFIRADIVVKTGLQLKLIEVKSKSIDPRKDTFINSRGEIDSKWIPYLQDVAFQKYVISKAYPELKISSYLLLSDKSSLTTVDGLNQMFFITEENGRTKVIVTKEITPEILGQPILHLANVDEIVNIIWAEPTDNGSFENEIKLFAKSYLTDERIGPVIGVYCSKCEFKASQDQIQTGLKSGFTECWTLSGFTEEQLKQPLVLQLWFSRKKAEYLSAKKFFLHQLSRPDLEPKKPSKKTLPYLSMVDRQELQIQKCKDNDPSHFLDIDGLKAEMNSWIYPLHLIDFETTAVAIPFNAGRRPYEQMAFQYSHHTINADGKVEHTGEWINGERGKFPNYDFIRNLKIELQQDNGTIFRYAAHENTILNVIYNQLKTSSEPDKDMLCEWIKSISHSSSSNADKWKGERDMVDLRELVLRYYYHPATSGSNSIKDVLPAILSCSDFLKTKYSKPIYGTEIVSNNYKDQTWIVYDKSGVIINPYKLLPPINPGIDNELLDELILDDAEGIADGGGAMIAYARMQFSQMSDNEKGNLIKALKRYCELDTLAMVMIVEAWKDWCK